MELLRNQPLSQNRHLKKVILRSQKVSETIRFFKENYNDLEIRRTGHTTEIITNEKKYLLSNKLIGNRAFIAYSLIKRDITESGLIIDKVPRKKINYHNFNKFTPVKKAYSIDISAAYPNALNAIGVLKPETYKYLMALKKADRLKAVGMLATQKTAYFMSNGKTDRIIINENPLANYFYYLCFEIGNLMQEIFMDYSENVYLFWVDGIFCNDKVKNEINKRVKLKYPCKIEEIKDLHYSKYGNYLLFKKDEKRKILPVPQRKLVDDGNILRFLV